MTTKYENITRQLARAKNIEKYWPGNEEEKKCSEKGGKFCKRKFLAQFLELIGRRKGRNIFL